MSQKQAYNVASGPGTHPGITQVIVSGDIVYISGAVGKTTDSKCVAGGVGIQTKRTLEIVADRLNLVNLDLSDITSVMIHLRNYSRDFSEMNRAYIEVFEGANAVPYPTRTCVGAELGGEFDVEITVTARLRSVGARL